MFGLGTCFFFFLMIRRPPRSTLFPYNDALPISRHGPALPEEAGRGHRLVPQAHRARSEEHTSELQSQSNLVCRLLLEKKKNTTSHTSLSYNITAHPYSHPPAH